MVAGPRITDICLVTRDLDESVLFYTEKLGYTLGSKMPGFADFAGPGVVLALWDAQKIIDTTGVQADTTGTGGHQVMVAIELERPDMIDEKYAELIGRGVDFYRPPADYPWNARCIYFSGPCGEFWEFFAWLDGGKPGQVSA